MSFENTGLETKIQTLEESEKYYYLNRDGLEYYWRCIRPRLGVTITNTTINDYYLEDGVTHHVVIGDTLYHDLKNSVSAMVMSYYARGYHVYALPSISEWVVSEADEKGYPSSTVKFTAANDFVIRSTASMHWIGSPVMQKGNMYIIKVLGPYAIVRKVTMES